MCVFTGLLYLNIKLHSDAILHGNMCVLLLVSDHDSQYLLVSGQNLCPSELHHCLTVVRLPLRHHHGVAFIITEIKLI